MLEVKTFIVYGTNFHIDPKGERIMHHFQYKGDELYAEEVAIKDIVAAVPDFYPKPTDWRSNLFDFYRQSVLRIKTFFVYSAYFHIRQKGKESCIIFSTRVMSCMRKMSL